MKYLLPFLITVFITANSNAQHIFVYKTESIICNGDTFWKRTYVNNKEKDTTYTYTPDIPGPCITEIDGKTYLYVERMPYPKYDLNKYLSDSSFISISKDCNNACRVPISFIIDRTGCIKQSRIGKSNCGKICESVALNLVKKMPRWNAGIQGGKPVSVRYTLAICFSRK